MFVKFSKMICFFSCFIFVIACKSVSSDTSGYWGYSSTMSLADFLGNIPVEQILYNDKGTIFLKTQTNPDQRIDIDNNGFMFEKLEPSSCSDQTLYTAGSNEKRFYQLNGKSDFYAIQTDKILNPSNTNWSTIPSLHDIKIEDYFTIARCSYNYALYFIKSEIAKIKISDYLSQDCNDKYFVHSKIVSHAGSDYNTLVFRSRNPNCLNTSFNQFMSSNFYAGYDNGTSTIKAISMNSSDPTGCEDLSVDSTGAKDGFYYYGIVFDNNDSIRNEYKNMNDLSIIDKYFFKIFKPTTSAFNHSSIQVSIKIYKCSKELPHTTGAYQIKH